MNLKRFDTGSSNPTLNRNIVHPEIVAFPPITEQRQLANSLDKWLDAIAELIRQSNREIDLLRELRTRLISDVVTAKLDVREAAASLPDDAEELDDMSVPSDTDDALDLEEGEAEEIAV